MVKDHYSMAADKQLFPTFILREACRGPTRGAGVAGGRGEVWSWGDQLNQLFVHKMTESLRVLLGIQLLAMGPEVEKGSSDLYNKV